MRAHVLSDEPFFKEPSFYHRHYPSHFRKVKDMRKVNALFLCAGKPTVPSPPVPEIPANIRVLASKDKQSCTER